MRADTRPKSQYILERIENIQQQQQQLQHYFRQYLWSRVCMCVFKWNSSTAGRSENGHISNSLCAKCFRIIYKPHCNRLEIHIDILHLAANAFFNLSFLNRPNERKRKKFWMARRKVSNERERNFEWQGEKFQTKEKKVNFCERLFDQNTC